MSTLIDDIHAACATMAESGTPAWFIRLPRTADEIVAACLGGPGDLWIRYGHGLDVGGEESEGGASDVLLEG